MPVRKTRYSTVSIVLHWSIFLLVFANATIGGWMEDASGPDKGDYFRLHRAVGLTVLGLTLLRIVWRITHPWPPFPDGMVRWERILARGTHIAFYVLTVAAPLLGLAAATVASEGLSDELGDTHKLMVKLIYVVLALHVVGALKHHFIDRDEVLSRMLPLVRRKG